MFLFLHICFEGNKDVTQIQCNMYQISNDKLEQNFYNLYGNKRPQIAKAI